MVMVMWKLMTMINDDDHDFNDSQNPVYIPGGFVHVDFTVLPSRIPFWAQFP